MVLIEWIREQLANNQVLSGIVGGGAVMTVLTTILYSIRRVPGLLWDGFIRQYTVSLTIYSHSDIFVWVQQWLSDQDFTKECRRLQLTSNQRRDYDDTLDTGTWMTTIGEGRHFFKQGFRWFTLDYSVERDNVSEKPLETITFRTLGRTQKPLINLVEKVRRTSTNVDNFMSVCAWRRYWKILGGRRRRSLESVYLNDEVKLDLINDVNRFLISAKWYQERGVPYRRGYLFAGPPGTGKTSMVAALASHFERTVYTLNIGGIYDDNELHEAFWGVGPNAIVVIEDIDAVTVKRAKSEKGKKKKKKGGGDQPPDRSTTSLSALLNVIDGLIAPEGQVMIMTTNYPERLDEALLRPGRVDKRIDFTLAGQEVTRKMFQSFYPKAPLDGVTVPRDRLISPAELQRIFMEHPDDPDLAAVAIRNGIQANE